MARVLVFPDKEEYESYLSKEPLKWEELYTEELVFPRNSTATAEDVGLKMFKCPKCGRTEFLYMKDFKGVFLFCIDCGYVSRPGEMIRWLEE